MVTVGPNIDSSRQNIPPGTRLNGIYEVDGLIALGGMGEIYKAHLIQTGDPVAIKLLLPEFTANEAALELFRREASALHRLQHDAIVRYYVFTVEPALQRPYLAMEFVEGRSLLELLERDGPLPLPAVRTLVQRIASGLQAAHDRGIIHRDVSPDNILLPEGDVSRAKIIDFGIARLTEASAGTVIGSGFAGKYNYVSPEQLGLFGGEVTAKSDIYSLGLVLVQALTGRAIDMGGNQLQIIEKRRALPDLGAIDMRLRPVLERMLQPNPADRPTSIATCISALLEPNSELNSRISATPVAVKPQKKNRRASYIIVATVFVAAIFGVGGYYLTTIDHPWDTSSNTLPELVPTSPATAPTQQSATMPLRPPQSGQHPPNPTVAPNPSADTAPTRLDGIKRYVKHYNGGGCFFVAPVAIGEANASLEGFGASITPFEALDEAFKKQFGFAPDIGVRQVTPDQCSAIDFLAGLPDVALRPPRIHIDKTRLTGQDTLDGTVDQYGERSILVFLLRSRGNISAVPLRDAIDAKLFTLKISPATSSSEPVLLIAIAARDLKGIRFDRSAEEFFTQLAAEAKNEKNALSVGIRYLRVER